MFIVDPAGNVVVPLKLFVAPYGVVIPQFRSTVARDSAMRSPVAPSYMAIPLAPSDGIVDDCTNHDQPPHHSPGFIANPKIGLLPALELKAVVASVCDMI